MAENRDATSSDGDQAKPTKTLGSQDSPVDAKAISTLAPIPPPTVAGMRIGRYRLIRLLGEGAFGRVWLGFDDQLHRQIAIKVPTHRHFQGPEDAEAYLAEARVVAGLDHPHIVPVFDVGRTEDGSIYVVSKYIEGGNLAERIKQDRPPFGQSAAFLASVAHALHHAHQKRLVHRDIKPANILIEETTGTTYVTDFGLAISQENYLRDGRLAGTPGYMSPEQARGEGHRLDGRSDIFSLGVVMYELLTGKRPFGGSTVNELSQQVITVDPAAPRELDRTIPIELERICQKALSKRASDRYSTAAELADDLSHWQQEPQQPTQQLQIVPKGLRSFDVDDAEFFLELLPGPRNRNGLPQSIQFWKTRIEETDPDLTFSVGLLYGPSGCGKSSLVKAGLLPRLSKGVIALYVEATPEETENRILRGLRKCLPDLPGDLGLVDTFAALRRRTGPKVVVVLDQFEQWLHARKAGQDSELVNALRQCDGGHLQAIVMVRDDFGMAATRIMDSLDIRILQGHNFATVDLFDIDHAQKVLTKFGQAFGKLPAQLSGLSDDQKAFLSSAVAGLAQDGKVVSVRLALFAEMVKGKPWIPATLEQVGGATGIGVNFLDETFSARTANPQHRLHQQAARAVLKSLLPEVGTNIKGHMRSRAEILEASGHQARPAEFNELLRILDGELRLITPTDPDGSQSSLSSEPNSKYYQLTHDYLVTSLRDWLTRKQRETRRGRAELLLAERESLWSVKPENRFLPSALEFLRVRLLTPSLDWTTGQRRMMQRAGWFHLRRGVFWGGVTLVVLTVMAIFGGYDEASILVNNLQQAEIAKVPNIVQGMDPLIRFFGDGMLERLWKEHGPDSPERLKASLALLPVDPGQADYLHDRLLNSDPGSFPIIRDALAENGAQRTEPLWKVLEDESAPKSRRFNAACALATYAPNDRRWNRIRAFVAGHLVSLQVADFLAWRKALEPAKGQLTAPLTAIYRNKDEREQNRIYATEALVEYAANDSDKLFNLLTMVEQFQFPLVFAKLTLHKEEATTLVQTALSQAELAAGLSDWAPENVKETLAQRRANLAVALFRLGTPDKVWPMLKFSPDPRVRTYLIHWLIRLGADPQSIINRFEQETDVTIRRALTLMLGEFSDQQLPVAQRQPLIDRLLVVFVKDPDSGLHAAAEWTLRKWGQGDQLQAVLKSFAGHDQLPAAGDQRKWYVNAQQQTFAIFDAGEFVMGSPESEPDHQFTEVQHDRRIGRRLAISATEITKAQYRPFQEAVKANDLVDNRELATYVRTEDSPIVGMTWYEAAHYCNWLSKQEGLTECYEPNEKGEFGPGMKAKAGHVKLTGYRLPTEAEWEYACRAHTDTSRYYGLSETLLSHYAYYDANGKNRLWPVASLKPNDFGLFDMLGNAYEWCDDWGDDYPNTFGQVSEDPAPPGRKPHDEHRVLRGGAFPNHVATVRSAFRNGLIPSGRDFVNGFRVVRTCP